MSASLNAELSKKYGGLELWVLICLCMIVFIILILSTLSLWMAFRRKPRKTIDNSISLKKETRVDKVEYGSRNNGAVKNSGRILGHLIRTDSSELDDSSLYSSSFVRERAYSSLSDEEGICRKQFLIGLPEVSRLGWGHWFTLRELEIATNRFASDHIIGEGGHGVVYRGALVNGAEVAVKKLHNNRGQAEKEFRCEVEAIGHVRHKHLVRLFGYCIEGVHRMLVYEYLNNGNLEQWLRNHRHSVLTWEARVRVLLCTAKALAYLHEAVEPKVVHRDIKSSNILLDGEFNGKVSDFGLAKLLGSHQSHVTTRVMGTFGYVAPEYAYTGLLNEKSDIYSFGILALETITGREPIDYERPANEVYVVEWLKVMVGNQRIEEVVDPKIEPRPSMRGVKRVVAAALRCLDPDSEKRPGMSQVVRMLEAVEFQDRRSRKKKRNVDVESNA